MCIFLLSNTSWPPLLILSLPLCSTVYWLPLRMTLRLLENWGVITEQSWTLLYACEAPVLFPAEEGNGRRELIYTQCHRREWGETQGYEANYSPYREARVPPPPSPRGGLSGWNSERKGRKWQIQQELETDSQSHSCCCISTGCNHGYQHHQALTDDFRHPKIHFFSFILAAFSQYTVFPINGPWVLAVWHVHVSISLHLLNTRWMMMPVMLVKEEQFFAAFLGSSSWCCTSNWTEASQHSRRR